MQSSELPQLSRGCYSLKLELYTLISHANRIPSEESIILSKQPVMKCPKLLNLHVRDKGSSPLS